MTDIDIAELRRLLAAWESARTAYNADPNSHRVLAARLEAHRELCAAFVHHAEALLTAAEQAGSSRTRRALELLEATERLDARGKAVHASFRSDDHLRWEEKKSRWEAATLADLLLALGRP